MFRRIFFAAMINFVVVSFCFGQAGALRDYVGLINQTFHPDIVTFLGKFRGEFEKRGNKDAAKSIDTYLKGRSGTGFLHIVEDGSNYIITNHHVITQSYDISVTFEKQDGTKIKYEGLEIVAADEDMDIALLSFPKGGKPFTSGLSFLGRPVDEGEDVYSAGFPSLGTTPMWQFGRGVVSNAGVEFHESDDDDNSRMMGPYIQHTAQIDPGNSGGPLLVQADGVVTGYAVAGVNTLSARFRQAANFSIPVRRVDTFLNAALGPKPEDELPRLTLRLDAFIEGLDEPKAVYGHIAGYLSNACTAENAEFALTEMLRKAPRAVQENIIRAFSYSPVTGMSYAVAWTIENALRSNRSRIVTSVDTVVPNNKNDYTVTFKINDGTISSEWVNEYGIWRIQSFGDFAAGDKTLVEKREQADRDRKNLKTDFSFQVAAGYTNIFEVGPAFGGEAAMRTELTGQGLNIYVRDGFFQLDGFLGLYIPIRIKKIAFIPYTDFGLGLVVKDRPSDPDDPYYYEGVSSSSEMDAGFVFSIRGGLMFTTAAVPGLFAQSFYQHNFYLDKKMEKLNPGILFIGIGYGF